MTCNKCNAECRKFGKDRKGHQRYRCPKCGKTFTEPHNGNFASMYTPTEKATAIIKLLVEGVSVRSIERLTDAHRDTILRVLVNAGERCVAIQTVGEDRMWQMIAWPRFVNRAAVLDWTGNAVLASRWRFCPAVCSC